MGITKLTPWVFLIFGLLTLLRGVLRWMREPGATMAYVLVASGLSAVALGVAGFLIRRQGAA
jgi:hypothetical protein